MKPEFIPENTQAHPRNPEFIPLPGCSRTEPPNSRTETHEFAPWMSEFILREPIYKKHSRLIVPHAYKNCLYAANWKTSPTFLSSYLNKTSFFRKYASTSVNLSAYAARTWVHAEKYFLRRGIYIYTKKFWRFPDKSLSLATQKTEFEQWGKSWRIFI